MLCTCLIFHNRDVSINHLNLLNILLSIGSYCNPVQLAGIANRLDEAEKERLIEGDVSTAQVVRVMQVL